MGVVKTRRDLYFPEEAFRPQSGGQLGTEHLYGDLTVVPEVVGQVGGHASGSQLVLDSVPAGQGLVEAVGGVRHGVLDGWTGQVRSVGGYGPGREDATWAPHFL